MKRILGFLAGLALAGAVFTSSAETQGVTFGLGGGLTVPSGDASDFMKSGFHGQGSLQFRGDLPFALRVDGVYHSMEGKSFFDESFLDGEVEFGTTRVIAGIVNGIFPFGAAASAIQPYASVGVGVYNVKGEASIDLGEDFGGVLSASDSETKVGFNGGLGLRFNMSGLSTFVEGRYHHITTSGSAMQMIPITVGVTFGR